METLAENMGFVGNVYSTGALFSFFVVIALLDLCLKGWGMWRAARMQKKWWFVAILIINSMGILPVIFLLLTKKEYEPLKNGGNVASTSAKPMNLS